VSIHGAILGYPEREEGASAMTKYLISFPSGAMVLPDGVDLQSVGDAARRRVRGEGSWGLGFGGGIDGLEVRGR
jgi:hypothetical protein